MTPAEIGVAYRVLRIAWSRAGTVPADLPTLIALAGLTEADAVHVQSLFTLAGQPGADGRSIRFPILMEELDRSRRSSSRRSAAGRANAHARWRPPKEPEPDPGGGLRLAGVGPPSTVRSDANGNANGNAIGIANGIGGISALSESSSGARRSSELSANQGAQSDSFSAQGAPGAKASVPWALDLDQLTPEQAAAERARRSSVHAQIHRARFPEATRDKEFLPSNVSEAITLAPWVTEELAAYAIWEARKTVAEFARRTPPEAFNPIGLVIAITGTSRHSEGKPRQVSLLFHQKWEKRLEAQRRQERGVAAVNARFAAGVRAKAGGCACLRVNSKP